MVRIDNDDKRLDSVSTEYEDCTEFEVFGHIIQRVGDSVKRSKSKASKGKAKSSVAKSCENANIGRFIHYWNSFKRWTMKKDIWGFQGTFRTSVDVIFERGAFHDKQKVENDLRRFVERLERYSGKALIGVLEYGEESKDDFGRILSVTPHYHFLLEGVLNDEQIQKLEVMVKEKWCFHSMVVQDIEDEEKKRSYVAKSGRFKKVVTEDGNEIVTWNETKGFYVPASWSHVRLTPVIKRGSYDEQVKPDDTRLVIKNDLLTFFGNVSWIFRNLNGIKLRSDIPEGKVIGFEDVAWNKYEDLEILYLVKKQLIRQSYEGGRVIDLNSVFATRMDIIRTTLADIAGVANPSDWFASALSKLPRVPSKYKVGMVYNFTEWLHIKREYYGDLSEHDAQALELMEYYGLDDGDEVSQDDLDQLLQQI